MLLTAAAVLFVAVSRSGLCSLRTAQRMFAKGQFLRDAASVPDAEVVEKRTRALRSLNQLIEKLGATFAARAALSDGRMGRPPRVVQLAQRHDLSVKEVKALQCVMLTCIGYKGVTQCRARPQFAGGWAVRV